MTYAIDRPQVFLCSVETDRATAARLDRELGNRKIATFRRECSIQPGDNTVLAVERALTQSDYFVLLWSQATVEGVETGGGSEVVQEWTAALVRELRQQRNFLFVLRLDKTPLPTVLVARRQLDAFEGWSQAVEELVRTWSRDRALGYPVLPAPYQKAPAGDECRTVVLYVRNRALDVAHVIVVPESATGRDLEDQVHAELKLLPEVSVLGGTVGMRFSYQLHMDDAPVGDEPLAELGITDDTVVDLHIVARPFGPDGPQTPVVYLGEDDELASRGFSPAVLRTLRGSAFGHLTP